LERVKIGAIIPELVLPDTAGNMINTSSFRGKYVLLDIWASWCPPCRKENPNLVKTYNAFKGDNFTVIGVSLDESKADWTKAIQKDGLPWTQLSDLKVWEGQVRERLSVNSVPQNYLIDPNGVILAKNLMGVDLIAKLKEVLYK
jgi:peroxiredoxin